MGTKEEATMHQDANTEMMAVLMGEKDVDEALNIEAPESVSGATTPGQPTLAVETAKEVDNKEVDNK